MIFLMVQSNQQSFHPLLNSMTSKRNFRQLIWRHSPAVFYPCCSHAAKIICSRCFEINALKVQIHFVHREHLLCYNTQMRNVNLCAHSLAYYCANLSYSTDRSSGWFNEYPFERHNGNTYRSYISRFFVISTLVNSPSYASLIINLKYISIKNWSNMNSWRISFVLFYHTN